MRYVALVGLLRFARGWETIGAWASSARAIAAGTDNQVEGNLIGTDPEGLVALSNVGKGCQG